MIELGLSMQGYRVVTAEGGERALTLMNDEAIDLLITDLKMPGLSGVETAVEMRRVSPALPVIVVTGYIAPEMLSDCEALGNVELIRKPFAFETLAEAVENAVGRP